MALRRRGRRGGATAPLAAAVMLAVSAAAPAPARAQPAPAGPAASEPAADADAGPPAPAAPPRQACPPHQAQFRLSVADPEPVLSTDLGVDALHAETGRPRSATAHHLGLTTSRVEWRSRVEVRYARARAGPDGVERFCVVPAEVALTLAQAEHRIRIAREIPPGSCLFREVEAHERRHVQVNRRTLRDAAARARAAGQAWARTAEARGGTLEEAMAALRRGLRQAIEPSLAAMREARARGHDAIDVPAEYRRLGRVCPEDQAALRERLRRRVRADDRPRPSGPRTD